MVLGWQTFGRYNLRVAGNEKKMVEWAWTFIPTGMVFYLCLLNLACVGEDFSLGVQKIVKVVGRQWL